MAAVPNESGFILEVLLKRYCAQVKGEQFAARFGAPAQFVVLEMRCARPLLGTVGQVAGAVVAVAAFVRRRFRLRLLRNKYFRRPRKRIEVV